METTTGLKAGAWYRMATGPGSCTLVAALRPTGRMVRTLGGAAGISEPEETWEGITEDGWSSELSATDIGRLGIGGLRGPVDDLPPLDADGERALRAKREQIMAKGKADAIAKGQRDFQERAKLPDLFPYLVPMAKTPSKSKHAAGAANLRRELERAFPGIRFQVTSKSYAGGCSIDAYWTYGPPESAVDAICDKYRTRSFDGMEDLESIRESLHADVFGGAGYVHGSRHIPHDTSKPGEGWFDASIYGLISRDLCRLQGIAYEATPWQRGLCGTGDTFDLLSHCNRLLGRTTFPAGFTLEQFGGVERAKWTDGEGYEGGEPWKLVIR